MEQANSGDYAVFEQNQVITGKNILISKWPYPKIHRVKHSERPR